jgi:hypothetical protein
VRLIGTGLALLLGLAVLAAPLAAQDFQPPGEILLIEAPSASTWTDGPLHIVQLEGPVRIELDHATLFADRAVIWLEPVLGTVVEQHQAHIALIGSARIEQRHAVRTGEQLFAQARVRDTIRLTAGQRLARNLSDTPLYRQAQALREQAAVVPPAEREAPWRPAPPAPLPLRRPAAVQPPAPVSFHFGHFETWHTPDGRVAAVLSGGVLLIQRRPNGDLIELQAQNAVLFSRLERIDDVAAAERIAAIEQAVAAAYLEGDVRVVYTPARAGRSEQRLQAERVYYDFDTDRAILTQAVFHTVDLERQIPIVLRAQTIRQLSLGEFEARDIELSTSAFATPSYSIAADRVYVRQEDTGDPRVGTRTVFRARHPTLNFYGLPIFYLPVASGSMDERGSALRGVQVENSRRFGFGVMTEWGFFESMGRLPPAELDITYRLDYYSRRGPAAGINSQYAGGFITETTRDRWTFDGGLTSFFVYDTGTDVLGRGRLEVDPPDHLRGRALWQHQHFLPGDWQVQLRAGYVSDATFLEQWFTNEFNTGLPHDVSAYFKRQRDNEALTLLINAQPNRLVTTADMLQEQFEIERLPEISYHRIAQALPDSDLLTLHSRNTFSRLRYQPTQATLPEQGFQPLGPDPVVPGQPAVGWTAIAPGSVYRGDLRQELSVPFTLRRFRISPYIVGRYIPYSDTPVAEQIHRFHAGTGVRMTTAFWKVDDAFRSRVFDLHRMRHVIEPELHLYTSAQTDAATDVYVFDEQTDAIHDIRAMQLAVRQRWQTQRGGPGRWRSVDFLTLNLEGNFFANQPESPAIDPAAFRGAFFPSMPEASIPRNSINADSTWRITDTTAVLSDAQYNLDEDALATAAVGVAIRRDPRLSYFVGTRYIDLLNSNITTFAAHYELTRKYTLSLSQSYDFGQGATVGTSATILRRFDRFVTTLRFYHDSINDDTGVTFNLMPQGIGFGLGTEAVPGAFTR